MSFDTSRLAQTQREYYKTGATRPVSFRLAALKKLRDSLRKNEAVLLAALEKDLNKTPFEGYMTELGMVLDELGYHIKKLASWARIRRVSAPLSQFPAGAFVMPEPYGTVLILSPWNYPLQLCLLPLIGALSAGNCAVVKPSAYAPNTSRAVAELLGSLFSREYVAVVEGGREENSALLEQRFDYIFFTGSPDVGRVVMAAAAKHLTPVTLELGGKSPVIVDSSADLSMAARRIAFGKVLNSGQTCVAPDYLLIERSALPAFVEAYRQALRDFFTDGDMSSVPVIINEKHYRRVKGLMAGQSAVIGGGFDDERRFIEPTLLTEVAADSPIMGEEIFGPVLPALTWDRLDEAINYVNQHEKPLALYVFTRSGNVQRRVLEETSSGGACVNDTIVHLATHSMGFGGVGGSGMGSYHGRLSFDTFTHYKSVMKRSFALDLPMRYHPYNERKLALVRRFLR